MVNQFLTYFLFFQNPLKHTWLMTSKLLVNSVYYMVDGLSKKVHNFLFHNLL